MGSFFVIACVFSCGWVLGACCIVGFGVMRRRYNVNHQIPKSTAQTRALAAEVAQRLIEQGYT